MKESEMNKDDVCEAAMAYFKAKKEFLLLETHKKENVHLWGIRQARLQQAAIKLDKVCKEYLNEI